MEEKKAFVFDTNFILQNKQLDRVKDELSEEFTVYVSEVSIKERIAQEGKKEENDYSEFITNIKKYKRYAKINNIREKDIVCDNFKEAMERNYIKLFGDSIIPIQKCEELFDTVFNRACEKLPPFSADNNASDKGFKDYVLWLSIIDYFKTNGEKEVVFLTDDNGFHKNAPYLIDEFHRVTGKQISIKKNGYYKEIIENGAQEEKQFEEFTPISDDLKKIRNEIEDVFDSICTVVGYDQYGNECPEPTFINSNLFSYDDVEVFINDLPITISQHIFEKGIYASEVFGTSSVISFYRINIDDLEKILSLYSKIKKNYPQYYQQFIFAATRAINKNYEPPTSSQSDDEELPF